MASQAVVSFLQKQTVDYQICDFSQDFTDTEDSAQKLGIDMEHIAKTLAFRSQFGVILIVTSGSSKIDKNKFKKRFGTLPIMLPPEDLPKYTDHTSGNVTPFALTNKKVKIYIDHSLKKCVPDYVYTSGGEDNSAIGIHVPDLYEICACKGYVNVS